MANEHDKKICLDEIHKMISEAVLRLAQGNDYSDEALKLLVEERQCELISIIKAETRQMLEATMPRMLTEHRNIKIGFEKRTYERWSEAFDYFEALIVMSEEMCEANDKAIRPRAVKSRNYIFESISHLAPRGILISREILCLLLAGYPDGALARWRSLHECTVIAAFLTKSKSQRIAELYLRSFEFSALRAAKDYNKYAIRANLDPFEDSYISELELHCAEIAEYLGGPLDRDYDWAKPALQSQHPSFTAIERAVGMDHWRPRYRWASQHTHAGHRPADKLLGMAEHDNYALLMGPSNSGFTDPFHMSSISLINLVINFLFLDPSADRIVYAEILKEFSDLVGEKAFKVYETEKDSLRQG